MIGTSTGGGRRRAPAPSGTSAKKSKKPKKPLTRKQKVLRVFKWLALVGLAGVLVLVGLAAIVYKTTNLPDPNAQFKTQTSYIYYADGTYVLNQAVLRQVAIQARSN